MPPSFGKEKSVSRKATPRVAFLLMQREVRSGEALDLRSGTESGIRILTVKYLLFFSKEFDEAIRELISKIQFASLLVALQILWVNRQEYQAEGKFQKDR
jgi:hypothetical protein